MAVHNYPVIPDKKLGTDILSSGSTFTLQDIVLYTDSAGTDVNIAAADFGTTTAAYGVFEPRTSREEIFKWRCDEIASYATGITITARGLGKDENYDTEGSTRKFNHSAGSTVLLFTNVGAFYNYFADKSNDETITGTWTFSAKPTFSAGIGVNSQKITDLATPTANTDAATKAYADGIAVAGASDANTTTKGIVEEATGAELAAGTATGGTGARLYVPSASCKNSSAGAGDVNKIPVLNASGVLADSFLDAARTWGTVQSFAANNCQITSDADSANDAVRASMGTLYSSATTGEAINGSTTPQVVCIKTSDGLLYRADANDNTLVKAIGFVTTNALISTTPAVRVSGILGGFTGLTKNSVYYVSDTVGGISATPSTTCAIPVGIAISTTELLLSFGKKIAYGTITHGSAGAGTQDVVTTIGFLARIIIIGGAMIVNPASGGASTTSTGINTFFGTTLGAGSVTLPNASATALTSTNIGSYVDRNSVYSAAATNGGDSGTGLFSMNAVSETGFTTRIVNATTGGSGVNTSGAFTFVALE